MHHTASLLHGDGDQTFPNVPLLVEDILVLGLEVVEAASFLQGDFQLRQVEVARVTQALQEEPVHDPGDTLVTGEDAVVRRDVENDRLRRNLLGDVAQ